VLRASAVALLVPSLALAGAPLEPRLQTLDTPQLLTAYGELEDRRPGFGGGIGLMAGGTLPLLIGALVWSATWTSTTNGVTTTTRGRDSPASWLFLGVGSALMTAGITWLVINIVRRVNTDEQLEAMRDELDRRERQAVAAVPGPELLALLAAPVERATGGLVVKVNAAGARVAAGERVYTCDARGLVTLDGLEPGPIALAISAPGFAPADEAASVVAGRRTQVDVSLKPEGQSATLTGVVRSASTGEPVPAQLEVVETNARAQVDGQGVFRVDVPGGKYTVVISAPGYLKQTKQLTVKPSDRAIFNVVLHPL